MRTILLGFLLCSGAAHGQNCPPVDVAEQKAREQECRAAGGEWSRFGIRDHLCGVYSCAPRTKDAGKPCRNRADCEHLCITNAAPRVAQTGDRWVDALSIKQSLERALKKA